MKPTHKVKIEIEFSSKGFTSLNHALMMFRTSLETDMPFTQGKITKFEVEEIKKLSEDDP